MGRYFVAFRQRCETLNSKIDKYCQPFCYHVIFGFVLAGIFLIFSPFIFVAKLPLFEDTVFRDAIQNSVSVLVGSTCVLSCASPMFWDFLMDYFWASNEKDMVERFCFLSSFIIPNCIFLARHGHLLMPYIFIGLNLSQTLLIASAIYSAITKLCPFRIPLILIWGAQFFQILEIVLRMYSLAFPLNLTIVRFYSAAYAIAILFMFLVPALWIKRTREINLKTNGLGKNYRLTPEEFSCALYLTCLVVFPVLNFIANIVQHATEWETSDWRNILTILIQQMLFCVMVTLLPNRVARLGAINAARRLLDMKRTFVRWVSHEIRSPLNVSHAGLEMAKTEIMTTNATDSLKELIVDISEANDTAITILNDLLQYENVDAGTFKIEVVRKKIHGMFRGKLKFCGLLTKKKGIDLIVKDYVNAAGEGFCRDDLTSAFERSANSSHLYLAVIDVPRIEQVIRNMITNAVKFTPRNGSITILFWIRCSSNTSDVRDIEEGGGGSFNSSVSSNTREQSQQYLRIEVIDTGCGIAPENQHKVFGQFAQFNKNELQGGGGSGLGLWLSRKIAHMHEGDMGFSSAGIGMGSTFYVEIPLYEKVSSVDISMASSRVSVNLESNKQQASRRRPDRSIVRSLIGSARIFSDFGNRSSNEQKNATFEESMTEGAGDTVPATDRRSVRMLLIDDSSMNRKIVKRMLEVESEIFPDLTTVEADDGTTGVEALRAEQAEGKVIDCVFIDFVMHEMHGPEAIAIMRNSLKFTGPIIAITGNGLAEDHSVLMASGANAILTKPISRQSLLGILSSHGVIGSRAVV